MSYNPYSLEGRTILITGASSGIGRITAIECAKLGAQVVLTGRNEERLSSVLNELEGIGHQFVTCDLKNSTAIRELVEGLPAIDGFVSNAGYTKTAPVQFVKEDDLLSMLQVNTVAPVLLLRDLLKKKKLQKGASVVFTSSIAGVVRSSVGNTMYASTKGAISAFVRVAAKELAAKGIRVNAVCPASVDTGILDNGAISREQLEADMANYPLQRYGKPEEVAWAIIYLLSEASAWTTGTNMLIDGGISIR